MPNLIASGHLVKMFESLVIFDTAEFLIILVGH